MGMRCFDLVVLPLRRLEHQAGKGFIRIIFPGGCGVYLPKKAAGQLPDAQILLDTGRAAPVVPGGVQRAVEI